MSPHVERTLTLRTRLPLYLLGVLVFLQLVEPDRTWMALLVGLSALLGISYLWAREMREKIQVERSSRGNWIVVGDTLEERFQLHNRSTFPVLWATVSDRSDVPGYEIDRAVSVDARSSNSWRSQGACSKRGVFTLGPWSVSMGDPIGLFQVEITYPEVRQLLVYPRVMRLPDLDLPRGRAGGRSRRSTAAPVQSVLPRTVRPYIPGDSLRLVHWRKSAQQQDLMIKEFDLEPAGDLWLVLDLDASVQAGVDQESTLEYGIILTASLAASHLNENRGVGLVAYGEQALRVPPQADRGHLWQLLHGLANAEPSHDWPLARVLKQIGPDIGRGRTVIVITPSTESDWLGELLQLGRRDVASSALLVDAASFDTARNGQLESLQHILSDHGVPNHVIAKGYPFRPVVMIKRKRKVLKTLSGTGRVIVVEIEEEI
ncbi:MAG: DUF58 domain-containing protein [Chloroflexi bacterium]|nr:DUF58 domain-containing protein [Chloroflexota bacterium]